MSKVAGGVIKLSAVEQQWADELKKMIETDLGLGRLSEITVSIGLDDNDNPKWGTVHVDAEGWNNSHATVSVKDMWFIVDRAKERFARGKQLSDGSYGFPPDLITVIDA